MSQWPLWKLSRSLVAAAFVLVACSRPDSAAAHRADSSEPIVAATDTGSNDNCPVTGLWSQCLLFKRLERMGLTFHPESLTEAREPRLSIAGRRLPIARGDITFFIYAD